MSGLMAWLVAAAGSNWEPGKRGQMQTQNNPPAGQWNRGVSTSSHWLRAAPKSVNSLVVSPAGHTGSTVGYHSRNSPQRRRCWHLHVLSSTDMQGPQEVGGNWQCLQST